MRLKDYDNLEDTVQELNENGWEITRYEYKMIDRVLFEMSTIDTFPHGEWISIDEELPEDGTWNLWTDGKSISIERYKMDALDHFEPGGRFFELEDAVAWMPIPETLWNEAHKFVQKK